MSPRKPSPSVPDPILVLDLGSASLRAALIVDGRPQVLPSPAEGGRRPTIVGFDPSRIHSAEDELVLGDAARRLAITQPRSQVFGSLRLAGRRHELAELDDDRWRQIPVERGPGGDVHFGLAGDTWPIPRLLGALIQSIVGQLRRQRELELERVVVSIAPGSDDARRRAVVHALRVAGVENIELVHGTTAAALAWSTLEREGPSALGIVGLEAALTGRDKDQDQDQDAASEDESSDDDTSSDDDADPSEAENAAEAEAEAEASASSGETPAEHEPAPDSEQLILVLDLGAGSFDAALARLDGGDVEVIAARSRHDLGGDDIDERLVDWLLGQFEDANEVDLSGDPTVRARMRDVAEKAKLALSDDERHDIRLPYLWADESGPKHLFVTLERERFERMIRDLVEATAALAQAVLDDAGQDPDELDALVMVGGCARIPVIQDRIEALFGRVPETELGTSALDDDFVVRGLALEAHRRSQRRPQTQVVDIAGRELWLSGEPPAPRTDDPAPESRRLVERNTPLPLVRSLSVELGEAGRVELDLLEGDGDERALALRVDIQGQAGQAELSVELDRDGRVAVRVDPPSLSLILSERVGLSARALERLCVEARSRARAAARRQRNERLGRRVQTLARITEAALGDQNAAIDELLRTSLVQWGREAEAALELGSDEHLLAALEAFVGLRDALPSKLREQIEDEPLSAYAHDPDEAPEPEQLGDPATDYDAHERVTPLELHRADAPPLDDEPDEVDDAPDDIDDAPALEDVREPEPEPEPEPDQATSEVETPQPPEPDDSESAAE